MFINRILKSKILNQLQSDINKIVIVYGPRQVGKTTLVKDVVAELGKKFSYYSCDLPEVIEILANPNINQLTRFVGGDKVIILDEAQRVPNIGLTLKILYEHFPLVRFVATGSSSFDLSNSIKEPLTGRKSEFLLLPFSWNELNSTLGLITMKSQLYISLKYGHYPIVFNTKFVDIEKELNLLTSDYLFKDILVFDKLPNTQNLRKLLTLLAYQIGSEVSVGKIANMLDMSRVTIEKYLDILERAFIIFRLPALSKNLYNEISKNKKYYFYDLGIRNSLIRAYDNIDIRNDFGGLWENFCVLERLKYNLYSDLEPNSFFWRTQSQSEVDYVESYNQLYQGYEFKWSKASIRQSNIFLAAYPQKSSPPLIELINNQNFENFVGVG